MTNTPAPELVANSILHAAGTKLANYMPATQTAILEAAQAALSAIPPTPEITEDEARENERLARCLEGYAKATATVSRDIADDFRNAAARLRNIQSSTRAPDRDGVIEECAAYIEKYGPSDDIGNRGAAQELRHILKSTPAEQASDKLEGFDADPARILKNALFALEKQKAKPTSYGGVLTDGGKKAWITYELREDASTTPEPAPAEEVERVTDEAQRAWVDYEPIGQFKEQMSFARFIGMVRHAFLSGFNAGRATTASDSDEKRALRWIYRNGLPKSRPPWVNFVLSDAFAPVRALSQSTERDAGHE